MPYNQRSKQLEGAVDKQPIGRKYEMWVEGARQRLLKQTTLSEKSFRSEIAQWLWRNYEIRYAAQRTFHIGDGVSFIVDFYFKKFKIAVEIDGPNHFSEKGRAKDEWRDGLLREHLGIRTLRFTNKRVLENPQSVIEALIDAMLTHDRATPSYQKKLRREWRPF